MKIIITYEVPTANGFWHEHQYIANSIEDADQVCTAIDTEGYILKDVTRDVYED